MGKNAVKITLNGSWETEGVLNLLWGKVRGYALIELGNLKTGEGHYRWRMKGSGSAAGQQDSTGYRRAGKKH